jgi:hypothetical protein
MGVDDLPEFAPGLGEKSRQPTKQLLSQGMADQNLASTP